MKKTNLSGICLIATIILTITVWTQSCGSFQIEKSVISSGGGQIAGGGFTLDGTIGQPVAGTTSAGGTYQLGSGFWGGGAAPSANATVSGRVLTSDGRGLRNATVSITDSNNNVRTATTSSFDFFSFDNTATGQNYTVRISSRLFRFSPQTIQVNGNLMLPDFVGLE